MFKGGSHWVTAGMSASTAKCEPQQSEPSASEDGIASIAADVELPSSRPLAGAQDSLAAVPADTGNGEKEQTEQEAARPVPMLAPVELLRTLESAAAATAEPLSASEPSPRLIQPALPGESVALAAQRATSVEYGKSAERSATPEQAVPDDVPDEPPRSRHTAWTIIASVGILGAFIVGALQSAPPDASVGIATLNIERHAFAASERFVSATKAMTSEPPQQANPALDPPRMEPSHEHEIASTLRFRNARPCVDAVACGVLLEHAPRRKAHLAIDPALGAAVTMLYPATGFSESERFDTARVMRATFEPPARMMSEAAPARIESGPADIPDAVLPIALSDIGAVEIVLLPRDGKTARAGVALKRRDGREVARFDLSVVHPLDHPDPTALDLDDEDRAPDPPREEAHIPVPPQTPAETKDALASEDDEPAAEPEAAARAVVRERPRERKVRDAAPRSARKKTDVRKKSAAIPRMKAAPEEKQAPQAPRPPRGLFTLDSQSEPVPASQREQAPVQVSKPPSAAPERSPSEISSQPTPRTTHQAPGLETLMGLGGG